MKELLRALLALRRSSQNAVEYTTLDELHVVRVALQTAGRELDIAMQRLTEIEESRVLLKLVVEKTPAIPNEVIKSDD